MSKNLRPVIEGKQEMKWWKPCVLMLFFLCGFLQENFSQNFIYAGDFGARKNSFENAAPAIQNAIAACRQKGNAVLVLPGGRIDIWPEGSAHRELYISNSTESDTLSKIKAIAFLFEDCKDIVVEGNNTLVVLHGKMISFSMIRSNNITFRNTSFDYERPTMSEMTVKSITDDGIETAIHPDSKYFIDSGRICFYGEGWRTHNYHATVFDPLQNNMHYTSFNPFLKSKAIETKPFSVLFKGDFKNNSLKPGDVITVRDPYRDNCGAFISRSKNIALENINMHYMHGLGIVSQFSENISLLKVRVAPRENSGRIISSWADCFHFSGCRGKISLDSCFTSGAQDDPVNIHGTHLQVVNVLETNKIKVRFMHHQTYGFEAFFAGDSIGFINPKTLLREGSARLKSATLVNHYEMELETESPLPESAMVGNCVDNLSWYPEVSIKNCRFERTHTRGILITTSKRSVIENNSFYKTGMFPVLIADDASSWFESGPVHDVLIRNNLFEECGSEGGNIMIAPENHELVERQSVHQNIRITGNTFKLSGSNALSARSVDKLVFNDNKIIYVNKNAGQNRGPLVTLTACKNVQVEKNDVEANESPVVETTKMISADIKTNLKINRK
jgi:hypothetical protein